MLLWWGRQTRQGGGMTKEYTRQDSVIRVRHGDEFVVALDANPTTGYQWEPRIESDALQLLERRLPTPGHGVGAGGVERFRFKVIGTRSTRLGFAYRRPWDSRAAEELSFQLDLA
jgi:inhibitor of cysteine peptidase